MLIKRYFNYSNTEKKRKTKKPSFLYNQRQHEGYIKREAHLVWRVIVRFLLLRSVQKQHVMIWFQKRASHHGSPLGITARHHGLENKTTCTSLPLWRLFTLVVFTGFFALLATIPLCYGKSDEWFDFSRAGWREKKKVILLLVILDHLSSSTDAFQRKIPSNF